MERVIGHDNLLEEILIRLPAEIVHGFIPVSKHWCSLISSLRFRRRHATHHQHLLASSSKILMFNHEERSAITLVDIGNGVIKTSTIGSGKLLSCVQPYYEKLRQKTDDSKEIELGICDVYKGLFLFSLRTKKIKTNKFGISFNGGGELSCLVSNPLTKEYHELPFLSELNSTRFTELAFAPTSKPCGYYKVLVSYLNKANHGDWTEFIVHVYSSETCNWKKFRDVIYNSLYDHKCVIWDNCLLHVNGGIWRGSVCVLDSDRLRVTRSLSLLPNIIEKDWRYLICYFGESEGFLYVILEHDEDLGIERVKYTLWEMNGVDGSWKEKFQVNIKNDFTVLHVHREGQHVWLLMWDRKKLYYCLNGITEYLQEAADVPHRSWNCNIRYHTPTLSPLGY